MPARVRTRLLPPELGGGQGLVSGRERWSSAFLANELDRPQRARSVRGDSGGAIAFSGGGLDRAGEADCGMEVRSSRERCKGKDVMNVKTMLSIVVAVKDSNHSSIAAILFCVPLGGCRKNLRTVFMHSTDLYRKQEQILSYFVVGFR